MRKCYGSNRWICQTKFPHTRYRFYFTFSTKLSTQLRGDSKRETFTTESKISSLFNLTTPCLATNCLRVIRLKSTYEAKMSIKTIDILVSLSHRLQLTLESLLLQSSYEARPLLWRHTLHDRLLPQYPLIIFATYKEQPKTIVSKSTSYRVAVVAVDAIDTYIDSELVLWFGKRTQCSKIKLINKEIA